MYKFSSLFLTFFTFISASFGQGLQVEGFAFETGNRGYLNQVEVIIKDVNTEAEYCRVVTDAYGQFKCELPPVNSFKLTAKKESYKLYEKTYSGDELKVNEKTFLKLEMTRSPGYLFEITLADKRENENQVVSAISGYLVEVYNNTTQKEVMRLENNQSQEFKVSLEKGNHYTILCRKENYLAKQMEVYVNVKGCILCFEGISDVRPGVVDNLTAGNEYGTLLANVEMEKVFSGKSFEIKNIFYNLGSAELSKESTKELDKVANLLKYNPNLTVQLVSHTDSRGGTEANLELSKQRAASAVRYVKDKGSISSKKIDAVGLGEAYPKNHCKDGVICSEAEHAVNRRTEVKVTGISEEWVYKPLVNIKNEEAFEKKLLEMTTNPEAEMTGEKLLESQGKKPTETKTVEKIEDKKIENKTNVDFKKDAVIKAEQPIVDPASILVEPGKITATEDKSAPIKLNSNAIIKEGFKILLYRGKTKLAKEEDILKSFEQANVHVDAFGLVNYLIGNYKTMDEAKKDLTPQLLGSFPKAIAVEFRDDRIIE
jgi:outer membrane protein OmpA-like peptidoglycan-associated protein